MAMRFSTDRVCLLDIETVYGSPATMTAADAILMMESEIAPTADKLDRVIDRPFFGGDPFVLVGKKVTLTGKIDLLGPPSADLGDPAPLGKVYRICQHSETLVATTSVQYKPISRSIDSATVDFFWAGLRFRLLGTRGFMDMDFSIKNFASATINLTGTLVGPIDGDAPSGIDWSAFQTPAAIETETWEVTVGGVNVCAQQLTVVSNSTVTLVECSEGREVMVTARKPGGVLRVFKDSPLSTWDPWAIANSHAIVVIENNITKGAGLNMEMPIRAQLELPKPIDIDGVAGFEIAYTAIPTGAGGDEYSLLFT